MDDLTMVLAPEVVATTAEFISVESAKLGLDLNFSKCELMSMQGVEALRGITAAEDTECPDASRIWEYRLALICGIYWKKYLDGIERETEIVCGWSNVQAALVLFRMCIATKLNYMLRSVPPSGSYAAALTSRATSIMRR
jgi:hypothetical protein